ncbi:MAG TPA: DUF5658 family protein [Methanoregulaceae archaeon]|nr:DUF5658 family protein [Methanoregulaceae archaeon]
MTYIRWPQAGLEKNFNISGITLLKGASLLNVLNAWNPVKMLNLEDFLLSDFRFPLFVGIILLAVLFGLDVATTNIILLLGGYEQNAIMALIIHYPVIHLIIKGVALGVIAIIVQYCDSRFKGSGVIILIPVILLYSFVIYNNTLVIRALTGN